MVNSFEILCLPNGGEIRIGLWRFFTITLCRVTRCASLRGIVEGVLGPEGGIVGDVMPDTGQVGVIADDVIVITALPDTQRVVILCPSDPCGDRALVGIHHPAQIRLEIRCAGEDENPMHVVGHDDERIQGGIRVMVGDGLPARGGDVTGR